MVMIIDPAKLWVSKTIKHTQQLLGCRFSPCGKFVFGCGMEPVVYRWELATDKRIELTGHTSWVQALGVHPNKNLVSSGDYHGRLICWPCTDEKPRPKWTKEAHQGWIRAISYSPNGRMLATAGNDNVVRLWNPDDGKMIRELTGHTRNIYALAFHPDGKSLASGDLKGVIKHWDLAAGKLVRDLDAGPLWFGPGNKDSIVDCGGVRSLAFNPDGTRLASAGTHEIKSVLFGEGKPVVFIFDWQTGERKLMLNPDKYQEHGYCSGVTFHPDGTLIGAGTIEGALWFWKPDQEKPFHTLPKINACRDLHLHPNGQ